MILRPEDFGGLAREYWFPETLAIANARLEEMLREAQVVYHDDDSGEWTGSKHPDGDYTHTAKLVCVEEVKP